MGGDNDAGKFRDRRVYPSACSLLRPATLSLPRRWFERILRTIRQPREILSGLTTPRPHRRPFEVLNRQNAAQQEPQSQRNAVFSEQSPALRRALSNRSQSRHPPESLFCYRVRSGERRRG